MSAFFLCSSNAYFRKPLDNDLAILYIFLWSFFQVKIFVFIVFSIFVLSGSVLTNSPVGLPFLPELFSVFNA